MANEETSSSELIGTDCDFPLPSPRFGHIGAITVDRNILVCGPDPSCLQFDPKFQTWFQHSTLPEERVGGMAVVLDSGLYILGGRSDTNRVSSIFLATGSQEWTQGPDIPGPGAYLACAAKISNTKFVILGGIDDATQARVYDEQSQEWQEWPRLEKPVWAPNCLHIGGDSVIMTGGVNRDEGRVTDRTVIFNSTGQRRVVGSLVSRRVYHAMVTAGGSEGDILVLGGNDNTEQDIVNGEVFDREHEIWKKSDFSLKMGRFGFSLLDLENPVICP